MSPILNQVAIDQPQRISKVGSVYRTGDLNGYRWRRSKKWDSGEVKNLVYYWPNFFYSRESGKVSFLFLSSFGRLPTPSPTRNTYGMRAKSTIARFLSSRAILLNAWVLTSQKSPNNYCFSGKY